MCDYYANYEDGAFSTVSYIACANCTDDTSCKLAVCNEVNEDGDDTNDRFGCDNDYYFYEGADFCEAAIINVITFRRDGDGALVDRATCESDGCVTIEGRGNNINKCDGDFAVSTAAGICALEGDARGAYLETLQGCVNELNNPVPCDQDKCDALKCQ